MNERDDVTDYLIVIFTPTDVRSEVYHIRTLINN